jgi:hypothetical protein
LQRIDTEKFNLRKTNAVVVKEQYQDDDVYINRAWESITENMKHSATQSPGYYELKQHKPWFDEEYLQLSDQKKKAKL